MRVDPRGVLRTAALCAVLPTAAVFLAAVPATAAPAPVTVVVAPNGSDANPGTAAAPLKTLTAAQQKVRTLAPTRAVTVVLSDGTYDLASPLVMTAQDSGSPGRPVTWTAARGAHPVVSGGTAVSGWARVDKKANIFSAPVAKNLDSRQLYRNGTSVPRAAVQISRNDVTITDTGLTLKNPNLFYLASLPNQQRIEVESVNSFTDRYAPVQSISGTTVTMQQPAWRNNNWGYDTLKQPFGGGQLYLENSYSFLQPGQWYLDPSAGRLYYRAPSGQTPATDQFTLPRLQSLVQVAGTYDNPVHDVTFSGIQFSHTTWLSPGTNIGYADQQNGAFIADTFEQPADYLTSCQSGCRLFEAARNSWHQMPAAVQVSAATRISFDDNTFANLGQVGLGLGNDADAHASGVGLGVTDTTVHHNLFTDLAGGGVVAGGVQPDAHHPSDPRMTLRDITIDNNFVTRVAQDYKEMSGILSTYADHTVIDHNEISDLAYDGIDVGWGWGANDAGGSNDYRTRGLYDFQPVYSTPTTLKDTVISNNRVHGTKKVFHDGGSIYNLSANPGAVFSENYVYDNLRTVGLYLDEGSRYVTAARNVLQDNGVWIFTNAYADNPTRDNLLQGNWYNSGVAQVPNAATRNTRLVDNVAVSGTNWPLEAQRIIYESGVEPGLRNFPGVTVANPSGTAVVADPATVTPGGTTTVSVVVVNFSTAAFTIKATPAPVLPAGWTVTETSALPSTLAGGASATATYTVQAPADATAGTTVTATKTVTVKQKGTAFTTTPSATVQVTAAG